MKKPEFVLRIVKTKETQQFSCLGEQLAEILSVIYEQTEACNWYAFDVDFNTPHSEHFFTSPFCRIDSIERLINNSKMVDQFLSGVFIAIKGEVAEWNLEHLPTTEEEEGLQHEQAVVEIRAFDTSYFEVYGLESKVKEKLKLAFLPFCQ
ncbi:hypothetical protein [Paenibacillus thiaminolyticus]|uniref:Uncharacterized protein n=1 Tax=Paenibacillus thiaminolyticus TaxID=49283 RepID=A0A3A3GPG8_PANTH|nr:hypothetical protein [Paenibacillus thiaminolyticus]RJG26978.1 hypothetical protein DQX05_02930 [Paenibacillus thiaminolyticus]